MGSTLTRLSWYTNMAAVPLLWNTNMAAVTLCENALYATHYNVVSLTCDQAAFLLLFLFVR